MTFSPSLLDFCNLAFPTARFVAAPEQGQLHVAGPQEGMRRPVEGRTLSTGQPPSPKPCEVSDQREDRPLRQRVENRTLPLAWTAAQAPLPFRLRTCPTAGFSCPDGAGPRLALLRRLQRRGRGLARAAPAASSRRDKASEKLGVSGRVSRRRRLWSPSARKLPVPWRMRQAREIGTCVNYTLA